MKNKYNYTLILMLLFSSIMNPCFSQNKEFPLWKKIPGAIQSADYKEKVICEGGITKVFKVSQPTLTPFLVNQEKNKVLGGAVIICPGGGYGLLAIDKEGFKVAKWLNSKGISAFVLKYRLPSDVIMTDKSIGPLQDAQEAIRMVRANAKEWNLDPNKIGIMGFSAGGHLASTASTHYEDNVYTSEYTSSARPDFSILIYPVISLQKGITHNGSKTNLLGEKAGEEMIAKFSNENQVTPSTPKTFLVHATDDKAVPVENSINYYLALKQKNIPVEMHIYESGGHGFGLGKGGTHNNWPKACEDWLISNGFLSEAIITK